jgi:hypothetical protein
VQLERAPEFAGVGIFCGQQPSAAACHRSSARLADAFGLFREGL